MTRQERAVTKEHLKSVLDGVEVKYVTRDTVVDLNKKVVGYWAGTGRGRGEDGAEGKASACEAVQDAGGGGEAGGLGDGPAGSSSGGIERTISKEYEDHDSFMHLQTRKETEVEGGEAGVECREVDVEESPRRTGGSSSGARIMQHSAMDFKGAGAACASDGLVFKAGDTVELHSLVGGYAVHNGAIGEIEQYESDIARWKVIKGRHTLEVRTENLRAVLASAHVAEPCDVASPSSSQTGRQERVSGSRDFGSQQLALVLSAGFASRTAIVSLGQQLKEHRTHKPAFSRVHFSAGGNRLSKEEIAERIAECRPGDVAGAEQLLSWLTKVR